MRRIEKYVRKLVKRQPRWLKKLFDDEKVFFSVEENGELNLRIHKDVDAQSAANAQKLIAEYFEENNCNAIESQKVH